jgi:hypothetical protein
MVLLLGILFLAMAYSITPVKATDDYIQYMRLQTYSNLQGCVFTDGLGNCISPELNSFDKIGVVSIQETHTISRVELFGSGAMKPVELNVNGVVQDVSCFQDSLPKCWENMTFDIAPTKEIKIFSSEHSSMSNHGYYLQWVRLWLHKTGVQATVDVDPDSLNLGSRGRFVTAFIELDGADVRDINPYKVLLNDQVHPIVDERYGFVTSEEEYIVDHDEDGILERMLKFDRSLVQATLSPGNVVTITISGYLNDGTKFQGTDTLRVLVPHEMLSVGGGNLITRTDSAHQQTAEITPTRTLRTEIYAPLVAAILREFSDVANSGFRLNHLH